MIMIMTKRQLLLVTPRQACDGHDAAAVVISSGSRQVRPESVQRVKWTPALRQSRSLPPPHSKGKGGEGGKGKAGFAGDRSTGLAERERGNSWGGKR